jgi:methylated-DNA-[protein]-cysteine S-methyltransferase
VTSHPLIVATPLGPLVVERDGAAVTAARFDDDAAPAGDGPLKGAIDRYFAGELEALDAIEVRPAGTDFQRRVWAALREIPVGTTSSYGALAAKVGSVARAVGKANGDNPVALIIPCHRVIGANGDLTGYAGGLERKRRLLVHEGAALL